MPRSFLRHDLADTRRRLRARDVLALAGREPSERARYFCPFHPDDATGNPSADVYDSDEGERFGCWSCGENMDSLELLMRLMGLDVDDALRAADGIIANTTYEPPKPRPDVSSERLEDEFRRHTTDIRYPHDIDPLEAFVTSRTESNIAPLEYLRDEWEWRGDYNGRLVQPHRDYAGRMAGFRYRLPPMWDKGGRPQSRFRSLYGGWRLRDQHEVWVAEGETDTTWAAWNLEPHGVGVVGLAGALMPIRPDEVELLAGRDVVLAFDPGHAGDQARTRWKAALHGRATLSILIPSPGFDLSSMPESLVDLWRARHATA